MTSILQTGRHGWARGLLAGLGVLAFCSGCRGEPARSEVRGVVAGRVLPPGSTVAVITQATVVAFWLKSADTIPRAVRREVQAEFRRSNEALARYLSDTDVGVVATVNDTVMVRLDSGVERVVMLSGLDFPYGYVFIEPGFAEEFHTGLDRDDELQSAADEYFGLEDDQPEPRRHIASVPGATGLAGWRIPGLPASRTGPARPQ